MDMMNLHLGSINRKDYRNKTLQCEDQCFRTEYLTKITTGNIDKEAMRNFANQSSLQIDNPE